MCVSGQAGIPAGPWRGCDDRHYGADDSDSG